MSKLTGRAEIEALLAERGRFETWLDQLSAKASTMPPHVVERVRADYQQRLDKVMTDLVAQADALRNEAGTLDERVRTLAAELTAKLDARAEDELRALVGEFDGDAWVKKQAEHDSGIQSLEAERGEREAEHARLQQLLAEAVRPARPPTPVSSPVVEAPPPVETKTLAEPTPAVTTAPIAPEPPAEPPPPPEPPRTTKRPSPFDEIGFMRAVVGRTTPYAGVPLPSEADLMPRPPAQTPSKDTRAVAPPVEPPAPPPPPVEPVVAAAPPEPPIRSSGDRKAVPTFEAPPIPDAPIVAPLRASSPAIPMIVDDSAMAESRPSTAMPDAARTLKCQECGWMNYPTEWYCEKCGGELAAF